MTSVLGSGPMNTFMKVVVLLLIAAMIGACGSRRSRAPKAAATGSSCTAPVVGSCPSCNISCPIGQPASCLPGEATGPSCTTPPTCKCN